MDDENEDDVRNTRSNARTTKGSRAVDMWTCLCVCLLVIPTVTLLPARRVCGLLFWHSHAVRKCHKGLVTVAVLCCLSDSLITNKTYFEAQERLVVCSCFLCCTLYQRRLSVSRETLSKRTTAHYDGVLSIKLSHGHLFGRPPHNPHMTHLRRHRS